MGTDTLHSDDVLGYTIPGEFDRTQRYIELSASALAVEYHSTRGYLMSVSVDPIAEAIDDEHGHMITSLQLVTSL